jgi:DtxR family Mn-dependent transcriptional regulator
MDKRLSDTVEDYLKVIYDLSTESQRVGTGKIAELLDVSPASVTDMIQRLADEEPPLLDYVKHQGVSLTEEGKKAALETIRHHRLLELFLHQILGFSWDQVHAEAERLEHVISEEFEERVAAVLGNPERGLHGKPIPSRNLVMPDHDTCSLSDLRAGQSGEVHSVNDDDPGFLRYLDALGLVPGTAFIVIDSSPYDDNLHLRLVEKDEVIVLGTNVTAQIRVETLNPAVNKE